jgi:Rad3-related DNA helicase
VITNYAYYLAQTRYSSGLGEFGLLVADEASQVFGALENHLTVYLDRMAIEPLGLQFPTLPTSEIFASIGRRKPKKVSKTDDETDTITPPDLLAQWQSWASCSVPVAQERVEELSAEVRELRELDNPVPGALSRSYRTAKSTLAKLQSLSVASGDWVIQKTHHGMVFTPRWVADRGADLFQSVPKVMFMSAILSHKTADSIGVPTGDDRSWLEVGSYFPPENTPIWHVPTTRVNYLSDDYSTTIWQSRIDQIIQRRLDRKGIVFTVSYDRARLLLSRSRYKGIMLTHSTGDVTIVVNRFKAMKPPAVLVSPTVTTGWDFPGMGQPQYIIVGKVPYPDTKSLITQARHGDDKDWSSYLAMQTLIQECGRMSRSVEDKCEILLVDDNFIWFMFQYKHFAPKWFMERWQGSLTCVPEPLV